MNGHPTREEDFDLYALGALEGDEKRAIESHIAVVRRLRAQKLAEARGRIALLALAAPPVTPSPAVKERLLQQIRAVGSVPRSEVRCACANRKDRRARWTAVLVPAFAVLAVATFFSGTKIAVSISQLAALRTTVQAQQEQFDDAREVTDLIDAGDTITVPLAQQPGMPNGDAHVMYNTKMGMLMYEGEMAPAPAEKLPAVARSRGWQTHERRSLQPAVANADHWMMKLPEGIAPKMFAVTLEPSGGMPQPTGPMVLVGAAS